MFVQYWHNWQALTVIFATASLFLLTGVVVYVCKLTTGIASMQQQTEAHKLLSTSTWGRGFNITILGTTIPSRQDNIEYYHDVEILQTFSAVYVMEVPVL